MENICLFCLETTDEGIRRFNKGCECMIFYHTKCMLPWISLSNRCPICKFQVLSTDSERVDSRIRVITCVFTRITASFFVCIAIFYIIMAVVVILTPEK